MSVLRKNIWALLLVDSLVIIFSIIGSYLLRFDFSIPKPMLQNIYYLIGVLLFSKISVNIVFRAYKGLWRYTSVRDLINIIKASSAGTVLSAALSLMVLGFVSVPRSIFIIDYIVEHTESVIFVAWGAFAHQKMVKVASPLGKAKNHSNNYFVEYDV